MIRHPRRPPDEAQPGLGRSRPTRRQYEDLVPEAQQMLGKLSDVDLHPAGSVPGVGTGQDDPHCESKPSEPSPAFVASWSHADWNMCQSAGDEAM